MISILPRIAAPAQVNINGREPSLEEIEIDVDYCCTGDYCMQNAGSNSARALLSRCRSATCGSQCARAVPRLLAVHRAGRTWTSTILAALAVSYALIP